MLIPMPRGKTEVPARMVGDGDDEGDTVLVGDADADVVGDSVDVEVTDNVGESVGD